MSRYSIAISPPDAVIAQVRQLKQQLRNAIGWYNSVNAEAHITFNVFETDAAGILSWETYTAAFAARQSPFQLQFLHTDVFAANGAFFLAPDEVSGQLLVPMMMDFHRDAPLLSDPRSSIQPHMSIARRLNPEKLAIARALIPRADIPFTCTDLVLRRFNPRRGQYDIIRRFGFGSGDG